MIESFLKEKEGYVKNILMSKPNIITHFAPSIVPFSLCVLLCSAFALMVWLNGDILAQRLPLASVPFDSETNILQFKVICTTILLSLMIGALHLRSSVKYTLTSDYITIEKTGRKVSSSIIMVEDIEKVSIFTGPFGLIGGFRTVKITKSDRSTATFFAVPISAVKNFQNLNNK